MRLAFTVLAVLLFLTACGTDGNRLSSTVQPTPSLPGDADYFRAEAVSYWDAFNRYDLETVKTYYAPSYLMVQEENLVRDIGLLEQFGVTFWAGRTRSSGFQRRWCVADDAAYGGAHRSTGDQDDLGRYGWRMAANRSPRDH